MQQISLKKPLRYAIRITVGFFLLFILLYILANVIIAFKKDTISQMAIEAINKQIRGNVKINDLTPNYFRTFPNISVKLSGVSIEDSLVHVHQRGFFNADKIFVQLQLLSLVSGKPKVGKVIIEDCTIHLFTDECQYCNLNLRETKPSGNGDSYLPKFVFRNTRIIIENNYVNSYHDIDFQYLFCKAVKKENASLLNIDMKALVHGIGFNMEKGSYLKEKALEGNFSLLLEMGSKLTLEDVTLNIEDHPFLFNGNMIFDTEPNSYDLHIETKDVVYKNGVDLLTQSLQLKLDSFDIAEPIDVNANINGQMTFRNIPAVNVDFAVNDSELLTNLGKFESSTFKCKFSNQSDPLLSTGDVNSKIVFDDLQAEWSGIPWTSKRMEVSNLLHPVLDCDLQTSFELVRLNELTESSTIHFMKGWGNLDIRYNGAMLKADTVNPVINGTIAINNAAFNYLPRNLIFEECTGVVEFVKEDLIIKNMLAKTGKTDLKMSGKVSNLLALININPEQLKMEWTISTPELDLNDFLSYVAPKYVQERKTTKSTKLIRAMENVDKLLRDGTAVINLAAGKMNYKKFAATDVAASIQLVENKILLDDVKLSHGGGTAVLKGNLINGNKTNQLTLTSNIRNVDIPSIFYAFGNFGQDAITDKNMRGRLSATINLSGAISDKASIIENSMKGKVDFSIVDGELIGFEPVEKIAAVAFKNRDFSRIKFAQLENKLELNGSAISFDRMEIRSNVVVLFVEGVYDTKKGTDMSIQIPVSNLSKAENDIAEKKGKAGVNVRLHAKTQDDGKLKVSWDPFNIAAKKREENM